MKRMAFLTALLSGAGHLPLLGAEPGNGSGIDASTGPAPVKPIRGYLPGFSPADGSAAQNESYALTYDIVHWNGFAAGTGKTNNNVVGDLTIERRVSDGQVRYQVMQQTSFGGMNNVIEAEIACASDKLNTLRSWSIRTFSKDSSDNIVPLSEMNETGENSGSRILIKEGQYQYDFRARNPVISQWTILDFLMRHDAKAVPVTFDLLQDLSLFKADQTLVFDETIEVAVKGGRKVKLDSYAQTGQGILPVHYMLDEQHLPQLVTSSLVSWALRAV